MRLCCVIAGPHGDDRFKVLELRDWIAWCVRVFVRGGYRTRAGLCMQIREKTYSLWPPNNSLCTYIQSTGRPECRSRHDEVILLLIYTGATDTSKSGTQSPIHPITCEKRYPHHLESSIIQTMRYTTYLLNLPQPVLHQLRKK